LECEWRVCVSSTDAFVVLIFMLLSLSAFVRFLLKKLLGCLLDFFVVHA